MLTGLIIGAVIGYWFKWMTNYADSAILSRVLSDVSFTYKLVKQIANNDNHKKEIRQALSGLEKWL